ncbi:UTP--glucose-1-phosphate uridylyltransferase [Lactococcus lactis]|nr:UTP--glucose-1-phosphate uridylyltransferase [Lactococcus lactis]
MKQNAIPTKARKVRKAVIPAAGLGTRFLPATKAIAKEMLPIVDKPTIQFIVEEALKSGIEDILIVTGKAKRPIEDHFDSNIELEQKFEKKNRKNYLNLLKKRQILIFTLSVNLIQKDWDMPFFKLKLLLEMSLL